jgi:hypothetical protein
VHAGQFGAAADQGDQHLAAATAQSQAQVAQAIALVQIGIGGPARGLEIRLQRRQQLIEAGIQHRAMVQIHQLVTASLVIPHAQLPLRITLQRQQGAVAIAEGCAHP